MTTLKLETGALDESSILFDSDVPLAAMEMFPRAAVFFFSDIFAGSRLTGAAMMASASFWKAPASSFVIGPVAFAAARDGAATDAAGEGAVSTESALLVSPSFLQLLAVNATHTAIKIVHILFIAPPMRRMKIANMAQNIIIILLTKIVNKSNILKLLNKNQ